MSSIEIRILPNIQSILIREIEARKQLEEALYAKFEFLRSEGWVQRYIGFWEEEYWVCPKYSWIVAFGDGPFLNYIDTLEEGKSYIKI